MARIIAKISLYRMIQCQEKALLNMKLGLYDVLPAGSLESLTSEDFRLLLNGVSLTERITSLAFLTVLLVIRSKNQFLIVFYLLFRLAISMYRR